jgi:hypothetical protein
VTRWPWQAKPEPEKPIEYKPLPPPLYRDVEVHFCNGETVLMTTMYNAWDRFENGSTIHDYVDGRELVMHDVSHVIVGPVRLTPEKPTTPTAPAAPEKT